MLVPVRDQLKSATCTMFATVDCISACYTMHFKQKNKNMSKQHYQMMTILQVMPKFKKFRNTLFRLRKWNKFNREWKECARRLPLLLRTHCVIDCGDRHGKPGYGVDSNGCSSAFVRDVMNHGICEEKYYSYTGVKGKCKKLKTPRLMIDNYTVVAVKDSLEDRVKIQSSIQIHPLVATLRCNSNLSNIRDDRARELYRPAMSSKYEYHTVLIIGYGFENDEPYYIIKNSWGEKWGVGGFGRVAADLVSFFTAPGPPYIV